MTEKERRRGASRLQRWQRRLMNACGDPETLTTASAYDNAHDDAHGISPASPATRARERRLAVERLRDETPKARVLNSPFRRFEPVKKDYELGAQLTCSGGTGMRYVTHRRTGERCVCRAMPLPEADERSERLVRERVYAEIDILAHSFEPAVPVLREFYIGKSRVYLVMELPAGGGLLEGVLGSGQTYTEAQVKFLFLQMLTGLAFLHKNGITDRDLSLDSFMLAGSDGNMDIRMTDLGMWEGVDGGRRQEMGTFKYYPPSAIRKHVDKVGRSIDMLSLGAVLFTLLSGEVPFYGPKGQAEVHDNILAGRFSMEGAAWAAVTPAAKDLVSKLLVPNHKERLTITEAMEHKWVRGIVCSIQSLAESRQLMADQGVGALLGRSAALACEINRVRFEKLRTMILKCWGVIGKSSEMPQNTVQWGLSVTPPDLASRRRMAAKAAKAGAGRENGKHADDTKGTETKTAEDAEEQAEGEVEDDVEDVSSVEVEDCVGDGVEEVCEVGLAEGWVEVAHPMVCPQPAEEEREEEDDGPAPLMSRPRVCVEFENWEGGHTRQNSDARDMAFSQAVTTALSRQLCQSHKNPQDEGPPRPSPTSVTKSSQMASRAPGHARDIYRGSEPLPDIDAFDIQDAPQAQGAQGFVPGRARDIYRGSEPLPDIDELDIQEAPHVQGAPSTSSAGKDAPQTSLDQKNPPGRGPPRPRPISATKSSQMASQASRHARDIHQGSEPLPGIDEFDSWDGLRAQGAPSGTSAFDLKNSQGSAPPSPRPNFAMKPSQTASRGPGRDGDIYQASEPLPDIYSFDSLDAPRARGTLAPVPSLDKGFTLVRTAPKSMGKGRRRQPGPYRCYSSEA
eukprot:evm.model.scf_1.22 EVM.evm.TU.scf_1.22   scf_1:372595-375904(-)